MNEKKDVERKKMGSVNCENCKSACGVYASEKTGRLSYSCKECGTQMFARTQESMSKLMERVNKNKNKPEVDDDRKKSGQEETGTGWDW